MALKDLVSDLSNFNGRSQYDKLDSQIKDGVDFIPNTDAPGFTPKTDLESLYIKANSAVGAKEFIPASDGTVAPKGGNVRYYAKLNPIGGQAANQHRLSSFGDSSGRVPMKQTTPPRNNPNYDANNYPYNSKWDVHISKLTSLNIDGYTINIQPGGFSRKNPQYINIGDDSLLPTPNLFDFQAFRERSRTSETPPFHSSVEAPFTNVSLPNIFSPSGYGVEFGLDGGTNLRDRYKDGSIHIFSDDNKEPLGGRVSMFAVLPAPRPTLSQFSNPNRRGADNISTKPEGFGGIQTSLFLPKEISRIVEGEPLFDTFNNTESDGLNIVTLKKEYGQNSSIKDLFEFKTKGRDTFKNVPSGINDKGNFGTTDFRTIANKGPFEGNSTHPIILRKPGSNWDNVLNESVIGGTAGNVVAGALGVVGLLTRTSVGLADKARVFKFMISGKGRSFIAKQFAFQALNPTLESKIYNPLSTFGIAGASDLLQGDLRGLLRAAGSFLFPTHVERHLPNPFLNKNSRYEEAYKNHPYEEGDGKHSRLAFQSKAFSIGTPSTPTVNTGYAWADRAANNALGGATDAVGDIVKAGMLTLSNPNKYVFPFSSAPKSLEGGRPSFIGGPDLALTDVTKATGKKGATFNKEAAINEGASALQRHYTLTYDKLTSKLTGDENWNYEQNDDKPLSPDEHYALQPDNTGPQPNVSTLKARKRGVEITRDIGIHKHYDKNDQDRFGRDHAILGNIRGNMISDNVDSVNIIPYGSRTKGLETGHKPELAELTSDFIKFRFRDVVNNKWIIFRAILDGITDTISPEFGEERYIGRPDKVYIYQGTERNVSFNFKIYPKTKQELPVLLEKLNYLIGLCYPSHTEGNRMVTPLMQLTIGDMFQEATGLLGGLTVTVEDATTWEIDEGLQFPHYISCACEFKYIGDNILDSRGKHYGLSWLPDGSDVNERYKPGGKGLNFNNYPGRGPKTNNGKDYKTDLFAGLKQG